MLRSVLYCGLITLLLSANAIAEPSISELRARLKALEKENLQLKIKLQETENISLRERVNTARKPSSLLSDNRSLEIVSKADRRGSRDTSIPSPSTDPWSGFFVGVGLQYGFSQYNLKSDSYDVSANFLASRNSASWAFVGYDILLGSRLLIGAEATMSVGQFRHKTASGVGVLEVAQPWSWEASSRLGFLLSPSLLVFGRAGLTQSPLKAGLNLNGNNVPEYSNSAKHQSFGGLIGAGVEVKMEGPWSVRLEYDRTYFSSFPLRDSRTLTDGWISYDLGSVGGAREKTIRGVGKLGLVYRFGVEEKSFSVSSQDWNGFYAGTALGGVDAYGEVSVPGYGITSEGIGVSAPSALLFGGYNWSVWSRWLLGIEGELYPGFTANRVTVSPTAVAKVRVGYAASADTLLYSSLGFATNHVNENAYVNNQYIQNGISVPKQNVNSIQLGLGVETKLDARWFMRFDYRIFAALNENSFTATWDSSRWSFRVNSALVKVAPSAQLSTIGVGYKF